MHELSIAQSVLEAVHAEAARFPAGHVAKVGVRLGALCGVNPDALQFCFEALVPLEGLAPLALVLEVTPRRQRCRTCLSVFPATADDLENPVPCPACGACESDCFGGDELDIAYLEVDDGTNSA